MADTKRLPQATYELLWWAFTLVLAGLILTPVYNSIPDFPFFLPNFVYIVVAITLTRYTFLLKISWLRDHLLWQAVLSMLLIPLVFWMGQYFNYFITHLDEQNPDVFVKHLPDTTAKVMDTYLNAEYRFFSVWAIAASIIMPFRLLYNVWVRYRAGVRTL
ncbi:MAG: hypothetical protein AAF597_00080 [Bacteroidota bacterium]